MGCRRRAARDRRGQSSFEYAVMLALVVSAALLCVWLMGKPPKRFSETLGATGDDPSRRLTVPVRIEFTVSREADETPEQAAQRVAAETERLLKQVGVRAAVKLESVDERGDAGERSTAR